MPLSGSSHTAVRVILLKYKSDHITPLLKTLHWFPSSPEVPKFLPMVLNVLHILVRIVSFAGKMYWFPQFLSSQMEEFDQETDRTV